jgi:hypothetical protein
MPNLTQAQVTQNLNNLQFKIAHDARTRADFLRDPPAVLAGAGLVLSPERARALKGFIDKQVNTPGAMISGAEIKLTGSGDVSEVNMVIAIKV